MSLLLYSFTYALTYYHTVRRFQNDTPFTRVINVSRSTCNRVSMTSFLTSQLIPATVNEPDPSSSPTIVPLIMHNLHMQSTQKPVVLVPGLTSTADLSLQPLPTFVTKNLPVLYPSRSHRTRPSKSSLWVHDTLDMEICSRVSPVMLLSPTVKGHSSKLHTPSSG